MSKEQPLFADAALLSQSCRPQRHLRRVRPSCVLLSLLLLLANSGCSLSTGDSSGDSSTGDTTTGNGPANITTTEVENSDETDINNQPNNVRNPDNIGLNSASLNGRCFIEVYKPDSENGTASILFSESCPAFSEVCMFRRPLSQVPPGQEVPEFPISEQDDLNNFEPFEEACGEFTSRMEGVAKWAFHLPGRFYTGDIIAEVANQIVSFKVRNPAVRQEDVAPNGLETTPDETASQF